MAWLVQRFQAMRCPEDAFLWGSGQAAAAVQIVPLAFPALGAGFLAANWVAAWIPGGRARLGRSRSSADPARERRQMAIFTAMALLATAPISFGAGLCQYCLTPERVMNQSLPWTGFRDYGWGDVSSVTATCRYARGRYAGWRKRYVLQMRDGATLDLMTWPAAALRAYPAIADALHGHAFVFDAGGVAPGCPEPYSTMLGRRR